MRKIFILLFVISFGTEAFSQHSINLHGRRVSRPVKWWVIKHLFVAHKAKCLTLIALEETQKVAASKEFGDSRGGQLDAFRHSYWMALLATEIKPWKVLRLGIAHEKGNYIDFLKGRAEEGILPDRISCAMDLYNNQVGVNTGYMHPDADRESLKQIVTGMIKKGKMVIIRKDASGNFLTCSDSIIDMSLYKNSWEIPKCLIRSDE